MLTDYLPILLQVIVSVGFVSAALLTSVILGKAGRRNATKDTAYECGMVAAPSPQARFSVKLYLVKLTLWLGFSFAAVCLGNHFAPRYFLQMLPPLAVVGARGIALALGQEKRWAIAAICLLLAVPFVRFGPRYLLMARHAPWGDIALDLDSQQVAARINALKRPGDTLFVWGYRPDMYVFTRLSPSTLAWDSQPLTGVPADRHLTAQEPSVTPVTRRNWDDMLLARPTFIVDGLGPLNHKLKPEQFVKMRTLFRDYREVARTKLSIIYHRIDNPTS